MGSKKKNKSAYKPGLMPFEGNFETMNVLRKLVKANKALAELKGMALSIPRQDILINMVSLQEAKDSSEIENIVTTHDELYKSSLEVDTSFTPESKEVENYVEALKKGFDMVMHKGLLTSNDIIAIQNVLEKNDAGFRKIPGTALKNQKTGEVVYEPPQNAKEIVALMKNLEQFINDHALSDLDPLVKMAMIHFQFESIHPFYDGNGRAGRIINLLYLILTDLLDIPILYLSKYIIQHKSSYYNLIQKVRDGGHWEEWIMFMLDGVEKMAQETITIIGNIKTTMAAYKTRLRSEYKFYSQDLLNHLFKQPYTKIDFVVKEIGVSRITAANYLNKLAKDGMLEKHRAGRFNYYVNRQLFDAFGI